MYDLTVREHPLCPPFGSDHSEIAKKNGNCYYMTTYNN